MTLQVQQVRHKLERVLKDQQSVWKSAKISFAQFDQDGSGTLDLAEVSKLIERLCNNLQLPPVDDETLARIFYRYDDGDEHLTMDEFAKLYYDLLLRIRDKYYPEKKVKIRRSFFIHRKSLEKGQKISDILTFKRKLGAGSFGHVYLVQGSSERMQRVCKVIYKDKVAIPVEQIEGEIEVMKELDHPHCIKIYDVYEDYNSIYILMEHCAGGELMSRITTARTAGRRLNEKYVARVMRDVINAVAYVHDRRIAHKDLKPENIMFVDKTPDSPVKVIDFGVAELFSSKDFSRAAAGTALYMAPEVYKRRFNLKCDVWSLGCILYLMLTCRLPFTGTSVSDVQNKICTLEPNYEGDCASVSPLAVDLLKKMLVKEPSQRPTCQEVLKHQWFYHPPDTTATLSADVVDNMTTFINATNLKLVLKNLLSHEISVNSQKVRNIIKLFNTLDKDGNGTLSQAEITDGLSATGLSQWDINKIVQALDVDDSGNIEYTEFLAACYHYQEDEIDVIWSAFSKIDVVGNGRVPVNQLISAMSGQNGDNSDATRLVAEIDRDQNGYVDWDEFLDYMRAES